jgi:hypothetical protein
MLDITKCLYDAISRLEKAIDKGIALAAAVEWVEGLVEATSQIYLLSPQLSLLSLLCTLLCNQELIEYENMHTTLHVNKLPL